MENKMNNKTSKANGYKIKKKKNLDASNSVISESGEMKRKKSKLKKKKNLDASNSAISESGEMKRKKFNLKKKKNLDASNSATSESGEMKRKNSKLKKKKSNSKVGLQNIQPTSDDNESDNICEFSDGEDTDDPELKNDVDKFIKGLNFEKCSKGIHFSDDEDEYSDVSESPKKKKLKSNKVETQIEIPDEKKCKNMKNKLKISQDSCHSESKEIIHENKSTEQESKKSKKSKKNKNKKDAEEIKVDLEDSPNTSKNESNSKDKKQSIKNKKSMLKNDKDLNSSMPLESKSNPVNISNENVNLMKNKKESSLPAKLSPKNLKEQTKNNAEDKKNEMMEKLKKQLQSASFRFMNEKLYTSRGDDAHKMFKEDPNSFNVYHDGYSNQVAEWPVKPLNLIISWLNKKPKNLIVADFGCGKAILAKSVKQKVQSLDLKASSPNVIECDMAHTPLESSSVDVVVFCLSLMGTNLTDFILEANRVLVDRGILKIAEIESRFEKNLNQFLKVMSFLGFKNIHKNQNQKYFWLFDFIKIRSVELCPKLPTLKLKPCIYKKR